MCHLISVKGVWGANPSTAYINTKSIFHQVSYISVGEPAVVYYNRGPQYSII